MTSETDETYDLQQDILAGRPFSLAEAIGREGGTFLKGESPIPKLLQAKAAVWQALDQHLNDAPGALKAVLQEFIDTDEAGINQCLTTPFAGFCSFLETLTTHPPYLDDFVRRVDMKWGQIYHARPYFKTPGQPSHPEDEYPYEMVHQQLVNLLTILRSQDMDALSLPMVHPVPQFVSPAQKTIP